MDQALESSSKLGYLSEQEKDKLLEVLLSDSPEAVVYCTPDLAIRTANRVFCRLLDLTMDKVIGNSVLSLLPDLQQLDGLLQKSRLTQKASSSKLKLPLAGAGPWYTQWKVIINPMFNGVEFTGWLLVFKEPGGRASEDMQPAGQNQESKSTLLLKQFTEKLLIALDEVLTFGYWECDTAGEVIAVSDAFIKTTGLSREDCTGVGWSVLLPEGDRERLVAGWKDCFQRTSGWTYQFWLRCPTGEYRVVTAQGFPVRDSAGTISSWFVMNFDTTSQHLEQEQRAKEAVLWQQLFKAVVNYASLGIAMYSGQDISLSWANANFRRFLELSEQARKNAGVVLENHLPYTENLQFDEVFYQAMTNRKACADLEVQFTQTPDSYWNCAVVPLTGLGDQSTDVMIIAVQIPVSVTMDTAPITGAAPEPEQSEKTDIHLTVDDNPPETVKEQLSES
ncbi:MAG TPA: PAS domain S-box protein, partial [Bacillota bacterium]|nr:PAS domain S-box protein [Bacillota bacterium]